MVITAIVFLVVAATTAVIGVSASWDQGLPEIMFWFTVVSLASVLGCLLVLIGEGDGP